MIINIIFDSHINSHMNIDIHIIIINLNNIMGVGGPLPGVKVLEGTGTFRGWGPTSRSLRRLKVHARYCVRTYLLYGTGYMYIGNAAQM